MNTEVGRSTAAYIFNQNKILLLLRDNIPTIPDPDTWDTPGGGCEGKESFKDCLIRELEEELELQLNKNRLKLLWESITPKGNIEYSYLIKITDIEKSNLTLHEGQKMKFFSFEELEDLKMTRHLTTVYKEKNQEIKNLFFQ